MLLRADIPTIDIYRSQFPLFNKGSYVIINIPPEKNVNVGEWMRYRFGNIEGFAEVVEVWKGKCSIKKVS